MYFPALQYKPRTRNVGGRSYTEPAKYRRLLCSFDNRRDAEDAAIELHSRHKDRNVTRPIVMSADLRWFDFARSGTGVTFGPMREVA